LSCGETVQLTVLPHFRVLASLWIRCREKCDCTDGVAVAAAAVRTLVQKCEWMRRTAEHKMFRVDKTGDRRSRGKGLELHTEFSHPCGKGRILSQHAGRAFQTMNDGGMISPAKGGADFD